MKFGPIIPVIKPRWYQIGVCAAFWLGFRYLIISWPRRHGKDVISFSLTVSAAMNKVGTYYYYFPTLEDGKEILWNNVTTIDGKSGAMIDLLCPPELVTQKNNQDYYIRLISGSIIYMGGTDDLKVIGTDGVGYVFSEWQGQKPEAFELVRPILRQNRGWVIFNGTMRSKENHLYKDVKRNFGLRNWFVEWLRPELTKQYYWESPPELEAPHRIDLNLELKGQINPDTGFEYDNIQDEVDSGMSFVKAKQEFLNEATGEYEGAYFTYELALANSQGRVGNFGGLKKGEKVYSAWDMGLSDAMAVVLFKIIGSGADKKYRFCGYFEDTGKQYAYYFSHLRSLGVAYNGHFCPHDAKKRSPETLKNFIDVGRESGFPMKPVPKAATVKSDIEKCRQEFKKWEIDLEGPNMDLFYDHISKYREANKTGRPDHSDDSSHGGDSARTAIMAVYLDMIGESIQFRDPDEGSDEYYQNGGMDEIDDPYTGYALDEL